MGETRQWWKTPAGRLVALVCTAQVFVQLGAFFWPALLPGLLKTWQLTNSEAGWITSAFYAAYMLSVPVLVTLTDRVDPKRIYLVGVGATVLGHAAFALFAHDFWSAFGARALAGFGWAGTYMTGLKLLADEVDAKMMSRATAGHAASIGISGSLSFVTADLITALAGWQWAFAIAAITAMIAWIMVFMGVPAKTTPQAKPSDGGGLFSFMPVFRNRSAMAYAVAYAIHTLEMNALRGWGVAFLGYVFATTNAGPGILRPRSSSRLWACSAPSPASPATRWPSGSAAAGWWCSPCSAPFWSAYRSAGSAHSPTGSPSPC
ncbi:MAG: MFS transporter [Hyphomicrobiaceae bacterium]